MSAVDVSPLPIDAALPGLTAALRTNTAAVLVAPPGAGKTTRVPLVLAREDWAQKARRILVLEPRRLPCRPPGPPRPPPPTEWRRRGASVSARQWDYGCGSARKSRAAPGSRSSPRA